MILPCEIGESAMEVGLSNGKRLHLAASYVGDRISRLVREMPTGWLQSNGGEDDWLWALDVIAEILAPHVGDGQAEATASHLVALAELLAPAHE